MEGAGSDEDALVGGSQVDEDGDQEGAHSRDKDGRCSALQGCPKAVEEETSEEPADTASQPYCNCEPTCC